MRVWQEDAIMKIGKFVIQNILLLKTGINFTAAKTVEMTLIIERKGNCVMVIYLLKMGLL